MEAQKSLVAVKFNLKTAHVMDIHANLCWLQSPFGAESFGKTPLYHRTPIVLQQCVEGHSDEFTSLFWDPHLPANYSIKNIWDVHKTS